MTSRFSFPSFLKNTVRRNKLILLVFIFFSTSILVSGNKLIKLKNGEMHSIKTYINGAPMHNKNKVLEILSIHPAIDRVPGWRKNHLVWSIYGKFLEQFKGTLTITSPLNNKIRHIATFDVKPSSSSFILTFT